MKKKAKFDWKGYFAPTPKLYRKIGDSIMGIGTAISGAAIVEEYKWIALGSVIFTAIGKFVTNMFKEGE